MEKKKNTKKNKSTHSDLSEKEHYSQILLEDMNSKIQLMAEQHSSNAQSLEYLRNKADKHDEDIGLLMSLARTHSESIKRVETRLTGVETRLTGVETRLTGVETRLDGVETRLTGVENELNGVKNRLAGVENKLDAHISDNEKRICKLEETAGIAS